MSPEETSLARLLVALPGFAWTPRMRVFLSGRGGHNEGTVVSAWSNDAGTVIIRWDTGHRETPPADILGVWGASEHPHGDRLSSVATRPVELLPDLHDPATAGVLLGMLWAADPDAGWHVHGPPGLYCVHRADGTDEHYGPSLGVAVARALVGVGRCA